MEPDTRQCEPGEAGEVSRRGMLQWVVGTICVVPTAIFGIDMLLRYLLPKTVLHEERFYLAKINEIPDAGLEAKVKGTSFIVIKVNDKVRALSTVCTHLGCKVLWQPDKLIFHCPCHHGYFDAEGNVTGGPPPLPLPNYPVEIEGEDIYIRLVVS